jgi:hypothetical protein
VSWQGPRQGRSTTSEAARGTGIIPLQSWRAAR